MLIKPIESSPSAPIQKRKNMADPKKKMSPKVAIALIISLLVVCNAIVLIGAHL